MPWNSSRLTVVAICGWLADHSSSRRMPLVVGLFSLGGATILLNLGPNIGVLILGRILQGISAAIVWTVGLALLADTVEQSEIVSTSQAPDSQHSSLFLW
jgi:MFS family permease